MDLTKAQRRALEIAADRPRRNICPTRARAAASDALVAALHRRGLVEWDGPSPRINDAGLAAIGRAPEEAGREALQLDAWRPLHDAQAGSRHAGRQGAPAV